MKKPFLIRQGDILVQQIEDGAATTVNAEVQDGAKDRVVLAYGEVTGHAHAIHSPKAKLYMDTGSGSGVLTLGEPAQLVHEEHAAISLPAGTFRVARQTEYTPQALRMVAD